MTTRNGDHSDEFDEDLTLEDLDQVTGGVEPMPTERATPWPRRGGGIPMPLPDLPRRSGQGDEDAPGRSPGQSQGGP